MGALDGRTAIVTGASSGIGKAVALDYANEGATVVLCARRLDNLEAVAKTIAAHGGTALPIACDVSREEDISRVVDQTIEAFGTAHILANIAQGNMGDMTYLDEVSTQGALDTYISGPVQSMLFMQKVFPHMRAQNYGRIINTGSHAAIYGTQGFASYAMAKGAMMALTRVAAHEWAKFGIRTNTIMPVVRTEAYELTEQSRAAAETHEREMPSGFGRPEDTVAAYTLLASERASYINGQVLGLDGGDRLLA